MFFGSLSGCATVRCVPLRPVHEDLGCRKILIPAGRLDDRGGWIRRRLFFNFSPAQVMITVGIVCAVGLIVLLIPLKPASGCNARNRRLHDGFQYRHARTVHRPRHAPGA